MPTESQLIANRKKSLKYYNKNKKECIEKVTIYNKLLEVRQARKKRYYLKRYGREVFFVLKNTISI